MLERIVSKENMFAAYHRVVGNKGCAGVDGMKVNDLKPYLNERWKEIKQTILDGSYRPEAVLGIEIDKPKGGKRLLGIPTVVDRMLQQAIQQVLNERFDPCFSNCSFGFRKRKSSHQAIKQALGYVNTGSKYVVDIDLSKFFDRVNFSIYVNTKKAALRVMKSITKFVESKLKLKVNKEKSAVRYAGHMELQGYGIYRMRTQKFGLKVIEGNWQKFVNKCKSITKKSYPLSFNERVRKLRELCYGWIVYFRYANIKTRLIGPDRLLGSRLRYCIWKSWKRIRTRIRNLIKLGVPQWQAIKCSFTRKGGWHIVQSPILQTTITNERLHKRDFVPTACINKRFSHV